MPLEKGVGRLIGVTILAAGALCALAGTGQFLLSDELFLGFYQAQIPPKMASTFVNWNHAASLYVLCAFIGGHIAVEYIGDKQTWWSRIGLCSAILFGALPWLSHGASAWVLLLATGCWSLVALAVRRITFAGGRYATPVWSPRGDLIAFTKLRGGVFFIGVMKPDGEGERLLTESFLDEGPTWAPNGRVLMFFRQTPSDEFGAGGETRLWSIDLTGYNERLVATPMDASDPAWSPLIQ